MHTQLTMETSQRSLLYYYSYTGDATQVSRNPTDGMGKLSCITQPFHLSRVPFVRVALAHHTPFFGVYVLSSVSLFISSDGNPFGHHCHLVASEPKEKRVFDDCTEQKQFRVRVGRIRQNTITMYGTALVRTLNILLYCK